MNPGWYPDPWTPGLVRWWDGTAWSPYTAPVMTMHPLDDLAGEHRAARRASIAVLFMPLASLVQVLLLVTIFGDLVDRIRRWRDDGGIGELPSAAYSPLVNLSGIAVEVFVIVWLYRAATLARRAGLPSRRDPLWAILGFIVPIVSLWFPYQVAVGCFPPGHSERRLAGHWWAWYLIGIFTVFPVVTAAVFSRSVAVVLGVIPVGAGVMTAVAARRLISAIGAAHEKLLVSPGRTG